MEFDKIAAYYESLRRARELMELDGRTSLRELKAAYRALARRWHPDQVGGLEQKEAEDKMKALNEAYELLRVYCERFPIPFDIDSLRDTEPLYDHYRRFYHEYFTDEAEAGDE